MVDALPVLSQIKSAVQAAFGDRVGARETQIRFSRTCPVVSQIRSAVEAAKGNKEDARETQLECLSFLLSLVEGTPLIGHAIGTGYYLAKNKDKGDAAMKSASRTTGVILGGAVGFLVGGPPGSVAGGSIGGVAMDSVTTGIDSAVHKNFRPQGIFSPAKDPKNVGIWVDSIFLVGSDCLTGYTVGRSLGAGKALNAKNAAANNIAKSPKVAIAEVFENFGNDAMTFSFDPTNPKNAAMLSKMSLELCRDGIRWYQSIEKSELERMKIASVQTCKAVCETSDNLLIENESVDKLSCNNKTNHELKSKNGNISKSVSENEAKYSILILNYRKNVKSLKSLYDLEKEDRINKKELAYIELGSHSSSFEEIAINNRKHCVINTNLKRSSSSYF